jgi:hypothetical protein
MTKNTIKSTFPGGESGIRTHGTLSRTHAFQACALSHSAISPGGSSGAHYSSGVATRKLQICSDCSKSAAHQLQVAHVVKARCGFLTPSLRDVRKSCPRPVLLGVSSRRSFFRRSNTIAYRAIIGLREICVARRTNSRKAIGKAMPPLRLGALSVPSFCLAIGTARRPEPCSNQ